MAGVEHEEIAAFLVDAQERLESMDRELERLHDENDRRAIGGAREELMRMMKSVGQDHC